MIARILIILLGLIVLPDVYLYYAFARSRGGLRLWQSVLFFAPATALCAYTLCLARVGGFAPESMTMLNVYLLLLGVFVLPKLLFAVCHFLGWAHCRFHRTRRNCGIRVGLLLAGLLIILTLYGSTLGFSKVTVRHETFCSRDLPESFDGYRIAHLSDIHAGTFSGRLINILEREADSVNAQSPDLIVFTGDLQNTRPSEIVPAVGALNRMKAKDGVVSVLGNHDYAEYIEATESERQMSERELRNRERSLGWNLLLNSNTTVRRGNDSIVIAGMENDGRPPFPQRGDLRRAQLTLSGHTHAMQFEMFGWSPASLVYREWGGMFREGDRAINVSKGMGGFIPFRIGASNEIVIITLRRDTAAPRK